MALDLVPYHLPEDICDWICTFRPEVIYSMLGSARISRVALGLAAARGVPLVPHFMDDWPRTLYRDSILAPWLRLVLTRQLHGLLARATVRLTIGDEMATEYERRYGGSFLPFMNCVELKPLSQPPRRDTMRLIYLGGLHLNRWRCLADIGAAVEAVSRQGTSAELLIYTSAQGCAEYEHVLNRPPYMRMAGHVPPDVVPAVQRDADILVHVEAFDRASRRYTRYSISTKIPEYMAAGRPVLAYGPAEAASLKYVAGSGCGVVVSEQSVDAIQAALAGLLSFSSRRREMGVRGRQVAERRHKAAAQRTNFQVALQRAVFNAA
jgi:glycosyltransferase involved in cell wall biosynthesis